MNTEEENLKLRRRFVAAFRSENKDEIKVLVDEFPEFAKQKFHILYEAAAKNDLDLIEFLIGRGFDINGLAVKNSTPLIHAIDNEAFEAASFLISKGARAMGCREIVAAVAREDDSLKYVKLLVENGADVNEEFCWFGDWNRTFTALDRAVDPDVIEYLLSKGAKTAEELRKEAALKKHGELKEGNHLGAFERHGLGFDQEVIDYFAKTIGPVQDQSIIEIVLTGYPIAIHVIRPAGKRKHLTLFTTGLSLNPMNTPLEYVEWSLGELYIELPGNWEIDRLDDPQWNWPIEWLRYLARHPIENDSWMPPAYIVANQDPPEPIAAGTKLSCFLLFADKNFVRSDKQTVHLHRVMPVHTKERQFQIDRGITALLKEFDRKSAGVIVDMKRKSVI
jgi:uncharacterized protein